MINYHHITVIAPGPVAKAFERINSCFPVGQPKTQCSVFCNLFAFYLKQIFLSAKRKTCLPALRSSYASCVHQISIKHFTAP